MKKPTIVKPKLPTIAKPGMKKPMLPSRPLASPIAHIRETGNPEKDINTKLNALQDAFPKKPKDAKEEAYAKVAQSAEHRMLQAIDNQFYFTVCFQTIQQRDHFLSEMGWYDFLQRFTNIDGYDVAAQQKIKLPDVTQVHHAIAKPSKKLVELT